MESPIGTIASLAASGTQTVGTIPINYNRSIYVTIRGTFHGSATGNLTINALYSPDGKNWDTEACDTFDLAVSAGNACQTTQALALPEHGDVLIQVENADAVYAATGISVWVSFQSWPKWGKGAGGTPQAVEQEVGRRGGR